MNATAAARAARPHHHHCPDTACVVTVGDGRGFIINHRIMTPPSLRRGVRARLGKHGIRIVPYLDRRLIITAAHCLPELPPAHLWAYTHERTYKLLGTLDGRKHGIATECLFVNPVADIAVLGCPDGQELFDEAEAYRELTEDAPALRIGAAHSGPGWVLSLDGRWTPTAIQVHSSIGGTSLSYSGPIASGMSGSPILNSTGVAVGIVAAGSEREDDLSTDYEVQPMLTRELPGWLLR